MQSKLFIWDFHGVLEKGNEKALIEVSNKILADNGYYEHFNSEDSDNLYGLKWYQYFERLSPRFSHDECLNLQSECFKYIENDPSIVIRNIRQNDHVDEVISAIDRSNHQQVVMSNTRQRDLIWYLDAIDIKKYFYGENIIAVNAHQTNETKLYAIQNFLKNRKYDKIIVIGDAEADLELGRAIGATTYFYRHPGREHEITESADYVINDLREVLKEI